MTTQIRQNPLPRDQGPTDARARTLAAPARLPGVLRQVPPPPPPRDWLWAGGAFVVVFVAMLGSQLIDHLFGSGQVPAADHQVEGTAPTGPDLPSGDLPGQMAQLRVEVVDAARLPEDVRAQIAAASAGMQGTDDAAREDADAPLPSDPAPPLETTPAAPVAPEAELPMAQDQGPVQIASGATDKVGADDPSMQVAQRPGHQAEPPTSPHVGQARDGLALADVRILNTADPAVTARWLAEGRALLLVETTNGLLEVRLGPEGLAGPLDVRRITQQDLADDLRIGDARIGFGTTALGIELSAAGFPGRVMTSSVVLAPRSVSALFDTQAGLVRDLEGLGQLPDDGVADIEIVICLPGADGREIGIDTVRRRSDGLPLPGGGEC